MTRNSKNHKSPAPTPNPRRIVITDDVKKKVKELYPLIDTGLEKMQLAAKLFPASTPPVSSLSKMYNTASRIGALKKIDLTQEQMDKCVARMPAGIRDKWAAFITADINDRLLMIEDEHHRQDAYAMAAYLKANCPALGQSKSEMVFTQKFYKEQFYKGQLVKIDLLADLKELSSIGNARAKWICYWALAGEWDQFIDGIINDPEEIFVSTTRAVGKRNPLTRPVIKDLRMWAIENGL